MLTNVRYAGVSKQALMGSAWGALERKEEEGAGPAGANAGEVKQALDTFMGAFTEFKTANDARLKQVERKAEDVVTAEKVEKINSALDDLKTKFDKFRIEEKRPVIDAPDGEKRELTELEQKHATAFKRFMRKGDVSGLESDELKTATVGSDPDGGYVAPIMLDLNISRILTEISPIRQIARVRQISTNAFRKPFNVGGATSGWVGETDARTETNSPQLKMHEFPTFEIYAMPAASQTLLDDAAVNIEEWLASEVQIQFAEQEGSAFCIGDGVNKPKGFTAYTTAATADSSRAWGVLEHVVTGANGALAASPNEGDTFLDLIYATKAGYRANARFVMDRLLQKALRKIKDADEQYIWSPGMQSGQPASLFGYPITEAQDMPDYTTTGALACAFGDFQRGYLVIDRIGVRVLRDPYTSKPYVLFYTTKRVGGGVDNFEAIKLMKFSA